VKDLISKLLCVNPLKRLSAEEALKHPWFKDVKEVMQDIFTEKEKAIILKDYHRLKIEDRAFTCADRVETDVLLTEHPLDT
jgi:serine/threonine protein kinase